MAKVFDDFMYCQWEFQDPKMEVPTIYRAYVREYHHKRWPYMVQYLHFRILKFLKILRWIAREIQKLALRCFEKKYIVPYFASCR
jgi:hypothetical protein